MKYVFTIFTLLVFFVINTTFASPNSLEKGEDIDVKNPKISQDKSDEYQEKPEISEQESKFQKIHDILDSAFDVVDEAYVDKSVTEKGDVANNILNGFLSGLDPHSAYLSPQNYKSVSEQIKGHFGGLGVEIMPDSGFIKVISPIDDSPAEKAGIKPGDYIVKIAGKSVLEYNISKAVEVMRGEPGSEVELTIVRLGEQKPIVLKLKRDIIKSSSVKSELYEQSGIMYIRISSFIESTSTELYGLIKKIDDGKIKSLIIDLRRNPGGSLDQAILVSNMFLPIGKTIVSVKGRNKNYFFIDENKLQKSNILGDQIKTISSDTEIKFISSKSTIVSNNVPIVVLIDEGTASASEILAAALRENKRAVLIGKNTFGKGSVQTIIPLDEGKNGAVKLTTARYYTPLGNSIQALGVSPDIVIDEKLQLSLKNDSQQNNVIIEKDLNNHLLNEQLREELMKFNAKKSFKYQDQKLIEKTSSDPAMFVAANVLHALTVLEN